MPVLYPVIRSSARCVLPVLVGPSTTVTPAPAAWLFVTADRGMEECGGDMGKKTGQANRESPMIAAFDHKRIRVSRQMPGLWRRKSRQQGSNYASINLLFT